MGLLDSLDSDQFRLGMGLLAAGGARSDGAGMGQRLMEGLGSLDAFKAQQMKQKYLDMQTQKSGIELDAEKLKLSDAAKAREVMMKYGMLATPQAGRGAGLPADVMGGLPQEFQTPVNSALPGSAAVSQGSKSSFFDHYMGLAEQYRQAGLPDQYAAAMTTAEKFRPKYSTTPQQMKVNGKLVNVLLSEDGTAKTLDGYDVKPDMVSQDLGGKVVWSDKNAITPGQSFPKTMTPGETASNGLGWANYGLTAKRDALAAAEGGKPQLVDGQFVYKPSAQFPNGKVVNVAGINDKPLNESQGAAANFGNRAMQAHTVLSELEANGDGRPGGIKRFATAITPGLGMGLDESMGTLTNWTQSNEQQKAEQAQRSFVTAVLRKESGASISPGEFATASQIYFPQPNDSDATRLLKQRTREAALEGLKMQAGPGAKFIGSSVATPMAFDPGKEARYQEWKRRNGQ